MSKYQYLDSEGLKKYHNLSGYTSLPLGVKRGVVNVGNGQVGEDNNKDTQFNYTTDLITLDPDKQYEIVINGGSDGAYIAIYDSNLAYVTHIVDVQPSYKLTLSETTGEDGVSSTDGKSIRVCAHYAKKQDDTSELVILKSVHDNATNYVYDLVKENTTLINENTSNIIRFHASHDITIIDTNPFEKGVDTTFKLKDLYLKLGDKDLTPDSYSVTYSVEDIDNADDWSNQTVVGNVNTILNPNNNIISVGGINNSVEFTYELNYKGIKFSKSKTINAYYPMYFGSSTKDSTNITTRYLNQIMSACTATGTLQTVDSGQFTKQKIKSSPAGSYSFAVESDQYIYLLVPAGLLPISRITSSGFNIPMADEILSVDSDKGFYKVYRSASKVNKGTIDIVIYT